MSTKGNKKAAMGRGLSTLLGDAASDVTSRYKGVEDNASVGGIGTILLEQIETNPFQPRTHFDEDALAELSSSIATLGLIQPITVRKMGYGKYQLISGERRFRASKRAGLKEVPAYIRLANDQAMLEMAIVENIQRENLDAIEVALSYQRLIDECDLTQEQLAERMGKSRSGVTNFLRLLKLPSEIQAAIITKKITMGHARALLALKTKEEQLDVLEQILSSDMSVRDVESSVKSPKKGAAAKTAVKLSAEQRNVQENLSKRLDRKVAVKSTPKGKGSLVIPFDSESDLQHLLELLG